MRKALPIRAPGRAITTTRFGTTADVPEGWRAGPPPENNDGLVFTSPDGKAELIISGSLNIEDDLDVAFKFYETPQQGEMITYKRRAGNAITISGTKGAQDLLCETSAVLPQSDLEFDLSRISGGGRRRPSMPSSPASRNR